HLQTRVGKNRLRRLQAGWRRLARAHHRIHIWTARREPFAQRPKHSRQHKANQHHAQRQPDQKSENPPHAYVALLVRHLRIFRIHRLPVRIPSVHVAPWLPPATTGRISDTAAASSIPGRKPRSRFLPTPLV